MPRFVILEHDHPFLHWDLMLEDGEHLLTWRLLERPNSSCCIRIEPLQPHRLVYLQYEGPVSGNRGHVRRWDAGEFGWERREAECLQVWLVGTILKGRAHLRSEPESGWNLHFIG